MLNDCSASWMSVNAGMMANTGGLFFLSSFVFYRVYGMCMHPAGVVSIPRVKGYTTQPTLPGDEEALIGLSDKLTSNGFFSSKERTALPLLRSNNWTVRHFGVLVFGTLAEALSTPPGALSNIDQMASGGMTWSYSDLSALLRGQYVYAACIPVLKAWVGHRSEPRRDFRAVHLRVLRRGHTPVGVYTTLSVNV